MIDPKVKQIFCQDANKAIAVLKKTALCNEIPPAAVDIRLFTITAHAMKSALANVGEAEASKAAFALESAGQHGDTAFISANTESFIKKLVLLIEQFSPEATDETDSKDVLHYNVAEDTSILKEQLQIIKVSCENFDDDTAYKAIDYLKEKTWHKETSNMLEQIRDMLFVYSDFDGVVKRIDTFTKNVFSS